MAEYRTASVPATRGLLAAAVMALAGLAAVFGLGLTVAAGSAMAGPADGAGRTMGLFGSLEFRTGNLAAIRQWGAVLERMADEEATIAACDEDIRACPSPRVVAWRALVRSLQDRHPLRQLREVNAFVNSIVPYRIDAENFGMSDYWTSPLEFLANAGDCEDFAILKFRTLQELGFSNEQLRIAVVNDTVRNLPHAVLVVELEGRTFILDSLIDVVVGHEALRQYVPQYSVNRTHRWAHIATPELAARFYGSLSQ